MSTQLTKRLSFRLTRNTVLLAMALGLVLNLAHVTLDYFNAREAMDEDIRALLEISRSPASQIAYNLDVRLAEELLDGLLEHPAIIDARIIDPEGFTLAASSRSSPDSGYRWLSDSLFEASRFYASDLSVPQLAEIPLGQLAITIDTYHYGLGFLERAGYTVVSGFIKSLVLSVILLFVFYFMLTKPMLRVVNALGRVDTDSPEKVRLPVPPKHNEDEIGLMVSIINQHLDTIDHSLAQLKAAESAMKNYSSQLESEVDARTREISEKNEALQRSNRALIKAKEDAVRRARSRASFLANMSHEIRTPLNGVLGMLDLALEGELEHSQRDRLEIAHNAGASLLGLLNDILDISKVEAGKLNLEIIPFNLRRLIEECATLHAEQARRKGIDLVAEIEPALAEQFLGDPTRTRQVINNLLSNAIKFTETGSVRISAHQGKGKVQLDIIDTGIGMSAEGLDRIFSPFSQADDDTTRLYGGTGLGLTLCRQLVERMHGHIKLESEPNQGTHFTVQLPLAAQEAAEPETHFPEHLLQQGVTLLIPEGYPHQSAIENQLLAWGIPVHNDFVHRTGILLAAPEDSTIRATAQSWEGLGVIWLDRSGNLPPTQYPVTLTLPLQREVLRKRLREPTQMQHRPAARPELQPSRHGLRLLLVEDNQVNQLVASAILKKLGHQVTVAENGQAALSTLEAQRFDLVLMDCQMPVMDGYTATRRIREVPAWRELPIVAVTANVMQGDRDDCLAAGMNDYISKPYNREDLEAVIRRWTRRHASSG
ncbi:hybrid sensor histidine kinase/response regulator [Marinobacter sp. CA1]|uniref:hybrid sensor histidine kinase/response regulator n=1 Tax=Marinobacter sp. CA1 TaxID=2817656 RepID=UPI001D05C496|nr:ATP-binding protein [Marinobacter sp. CA1]